MRITPILLFFKLVQVIIPPLVFSDFFLLVMNSLPSLDVHSCLYELASDHFKLIVQIFVFLSNLKVLKDKDYASCSVRSWHSIL